MNLKATHKLHINWYFLHKQNPVVTQIIQKQSSYFQAFYNCLHAYNAILKSQSFKYRKSTICFSISFLLKVTVNLCSTFESFIGKLVVFTTNLNFNISKQLKLFVKIVRGNTIIVTRNKLGLSCAKLRLKFACLLSCC